MKANASFVLLESDTAGTGYLALSCARRLGLRPFLFHEPQSSYRSLAQFESVALPILDLETVLAKIDCLGRQHIKGVWSVRDAYLGLAASVAHALDLPSADPGAIRICCDKLKTREVLAEAGLREVPFGLAKSGAETAAIASHLSGRVVVKPRFSTGSLGVRLCSSPDEAQGYFHTLARNLPEVSHQGVLVEAFVEGQQYSVQLFNGRSLGVTHQTLGSAPTFVTTGLEFPWREDPQLHAEIVKHAEEAAAAVGHVLGPGCVDIRCGPRGPCLIEINPRLAGDLIAENIRLATGIDVVDATIRFACGMSYDLQPNYNRGSASRWLLRPDRPVRGVAGREEALASPGVVHVRLFPRHFMREGPTGDFRDRLALVVTEAETAKRAGQFAEDAVSRLAVVPPDDPQSSWIAKARAAATTIARCLTKSLSMSYSLVSDENSLEALRPEWDDLFQRIESPTPFLRHSWVKLCWERQRHVPGTSL